MLTRSELHKTRLESGFEIAYRILGDGPPLLLLHGYPQTHVMWGRIAPALAETFTLVLSDLRGYGDSGKPESDPRHEAYSFRSMAADQAELMQRLGFDSYFVAGHDRGGRVAHRLCLDRAECVHKLALLDIAPTLTMFERTDMAFAIAYYHWFFLAQPAPIPEKLIGADPEFYLRRKLSAWSGVPLNTLEKVFTSAALAEYVRCFRDPATLHATCEDYRASAGIDLEHDRADRVAGRKLVCPLMVLYGERGVVARTYDVLDVWRQVSAADVTATALPCGHFPAEEAPAETLEKLLDFFV